jgi:Peptidase propeptide and YPEB domain
MRILGTALLIAALASATNMAHAGWFSDELPSASAKPLSEIIKAVEDKGYKTITDVEFDDGVWRIEVHQPDGNEVHINVDPANGTIR